MRRRFSVMVFMVLSSTVAWRADAACMVSRPAERSTVEAFVDDPPSLLRRHPTGDLALANEVQALAMASPQSLEGVFSVARRASFDQAEAIGVGLKKVVWSCMGRDPDLVRRVRDGVRDRTTRDVVKGFMADERRSAPLQYGGVEGLGSNTSISTGATAPDGTPAPGLSGLSLKPGMRIGADAPVSSSHLSPTQALDGSDLQLPNPDKRYAPPKVD